ncbi:hypothetical protein T08_3858 [Trichinella sp. T8]|nr:hypothetical protein T08_7174 [Trichinella sp. T8]KRZ90400.1 hypothetical protein T08_3858 [Trichinella sp. T8]
MERRKITSTILTLIAKSPIRKLQMPRSKSTSEPNCIQFDAVRGWKHCVLIRKLTAANVERQTTDLLSFYSLLFFGIISEK